MNKYGIEEKTTIKSRCFFCFSDQFVLYDNKLPNHGDIVQCANCGNFNDYDSLIRVRNCRVEEWLQEQGNKLIESFAKDLENTFKKFH